MNLDRFRIAHDVAYSAKRIVILPEPLAGPWVVIRDPAPISIGRDLVNAALALRNIGAEECRIESIRSSHAALTIAGHPERQILAAHTREERATGVDVVIQPFRLTNSRTPIVVEIEFRGLVSGTQRIATCTVDCVRQQAAGAVLLIDPPELTFRAHVRGLHPFVTPAPGARAVELDIVDPPGPYRRKGMRRDAAGVFALAVPLQEGTRCAYRFSIDGSFQRDAAVPMVEDVPGAGPCSPLDVPRRGEQELHVRNGGTHDLTLEARTDTPWIAVSPSRHRIRPGHGAAVAVRVATPGLGCGKHVGALTLTTNDPAAAVYTLPVMLHLDACGAVMADVPGSLKLGAVYVGHAAERSLALSNAGSAPLVGRITSDDDGFKPVEFTIPPASAAAVPIRIQHHHRPKGGSEKRQARLRVETNTVVVDEERIEIPISYDLALTPLKFTPAAVDFGAVTIGHRASFQVGIRNEAGGTVDAEIGSDFRLPPWLRLSMARPGEMVVEVRADDWRSFKDEVVNLAIPLRDRKSEYTGVLDVRGELVVPQLEAPPRRLRFHSRPKPAVKQLPLALKNVGRGDLDVRQIVIDQKWVSVSAAPATDSGVTLNVTVDAAKLAAGTHHAQVDFHTNDPVRPTTGVAIDVRVQ